MRVSETVFSAHSLQFTVYMLNLIFLFQFVQLETSGLFMVQTVLRVEWRSATAANGAQCVMTHGIIVMLVWPVDSWDSHQQVTLYSILASM